VRALAIIPARGGSKGIHHKNLAMCAGKPLMQWALDTAVEALGNDVVLTSDDVEILAQADGIPIWQHLRPTELAQDDTPTEAVLENVLSLDDFQKFDIGVLIQPTSPLVTAEDINSCIAHVEGGYESCLSVVPSHAFMWQPGPDGALSTNYAWEKRPRRQDIKIPQYEENGAVYAFWLPWSGNRLKQPIGMHVMPEESRIQVDTPFDLWMAEQILLRREARVATG